MQALQFVVSAVRRAKAESRCSFKNLPLVAVVVMPLADRVLLCLGTNSETARRLLRLDCLTLQEAGWDTSPGSMFDEYEWFVGCHKDSQTGIEVVLWATQNPWQEST